MKKILLPTDFSDNARNAIRYGMEMFGKEVYEDQVEFTIMHVHQVPSTIIIPSTYAAPAEPSEIVEEIEEELTRECVLFRKEYPEQVIKKMLQSGNAVDVICMVAEEEGFDFLVMGTRGKSGLERFLVGSVSSGVARCAHCPVLVIPEEASFRVPEKMVFATDFRNLEDLKILNPLRDVAGTFRPEFLTLHIFPKDDTSEQEREVMNRILSVYFRTVKYRHYFFEYGDPAEGIEEFLTGYNADMLALVRQDRSFVANIFHQSVTQQMLIHTSIPLFILRLPKSDEKRERLELAEDEWQDRLEEWAADLEEWKVRFRLGKENTMDELKRNKEQFFEWAELMRSRIKGKNSDLDRLGRRLKAGLEDLQVQFTLGKAETEESFEKKKEQLRKTVDKVKDQIREMLRPKEKSD